MLSSITSYGSIAIALSAAALLVFAIITLTTRRHRAQDPFELGAVSQQWLVGHKGENDV